MHIPPTALLAALDELDDHTAARLAPLLKALLSALEARSRHALEQQRLADHECRQDPLWPDGENPF